jgi:hypothetical protein
MQLFAEWPDIKSRKVDTDELGDPAAVTARLRTRKPATIGFVIHIGRQHSSIHTRSNDGLQ